MTKGYISEFVVEHVPSGIGSGRELERNPLIAATASILCYRSYLTANSSPSEVTHLRQHDGKSTELHRVTLFPQRHDSARSAGYVNSDDKVNLGE